MRKLLIILLFCGALICGTAHAGGWSFGGSVGSSQLDSRHHDDAEVATEPVVGLHLSWWFHRNLAAEVAWVHAGTGYRADGARKDRDLDAGLVGLRGMMTVGERYFVQARGGFAELHIDTDAGGIAPVRDGAERSHYLGVGFGWQWNDRWRSTLELTRIYGDVAYGCDSGGCATTHSSYFDSLAIGVEWHFD